MKVETLDDGSTICADEHGVMQWHDMGGGVSLHVRRGVMTRAFARYVIADGERQLETANRFVLMVDAVEVKMHTTEFRDTMTGWFGAHAGAQVHMLIKSRMLEMALNVSNLSMGVTRATTYYSSADWEAVGKGFVESFERRPLVIPDGLRS